MQSTRKEAIPQIKAGDVVIYVARYGAMPVRTNVDRVTKTGQVYVQADGAKARFKRHWSGRWEPVDSACRATIHEDSNGKWDELVEAHHVKANEDAERASAEKERIKEAKKREAKEMAETKKAVRSLENAYAGTEGVHLDEGHRLYILFLPVKPGKGPKFISATVYVEDYKGWGSEGKTVINGRASYMTDQTSGSLSFRDCKDDEALLWEAINYLYHRA